MYRVIEVSVLPPRCGGFHWIWIAFSVPVWLPERLVTTVGTAPATSIVRLALADNGRSSLVQIALVVEHCPVAVAGSVRLVSAAPAGCTLSVQPILLPLVWRLARVIEPFVVLIALFRSVL